MRRPRTTARSLFLLLLLLGIVAGTAAASARKPPRLIFPVLGRASFIDDFGDPRATGRHQGIDIMAPRKALALAAEAGKVKFWSGSGCMLYLYGASGTKYMYVHLNNDLTRGNDNRGKCVPGTAYARDLKDGAKVTAGQPIGFVGDSGDADGIHPHLHFEVHPGGGAAVNPYSYLRAAQRLLFAAPAGSPFTLELTATVTAVNDASLQVKVSALNAWPMRQFQRKISRVLTLRVSDLTVVQSAARARTMQLSQARKGQPAVIWTAPEVTTLRAQRGDALAITAALVLLKTKS
jgi:Peptidase family M23